ncbi:unnamed protein product [Spirodela intermedia]|uniref:Uncharacterized protein n=1 Tax=Spirodela intermedia TaxID=51605 RepID=A0A7I8ILQ3_SPIIN|nr:unnamed protein product [Spirodela intermedia]CAA6658449.1 unnamed protein product [Spirodela intermedia]
MKLDFMPPSLINFISRQLIGNGHKLYQKAIASVVASNGDYRDALKRQLYARLRGQGDPSARAVTGQRSRSRISPEVESALSMMNEVIGVFRGLGSQQGGRNLPIFAERQTSAMEEGYGKQRFSDEKLAKSQLFAELRKPRSSAPSPSPGESLGAGGLENPTMAMVGETAGGGSRVNDAAADRGKVGEEAARSRKGKWWRFSCLSCFN